MTFTLGAMALLCGSTVTAWPVLVQGSPEADSSSGVVVDLRAVGQSASEQLNLEMGPWDLGPYETLKFTGLDVNFTPIHDGTAVVEFFGSGAHNLENCEVMSDQDGDGKVDFDLSAHENAQTPTLDNGHFGWSSDTGTDSARVELQVIGGTRTEVSCEASHPLTYAESLGQRQMFLPAVYVISDVVPTCVKVQAPMWDIPGGTYLGVEDASCREAISIGGVKEDGDFVSEKQTTYNEVNATGVVAAEQPEITARIWWSGVLLGLGTACLAPMITWMEDRRQRHLAAQVSNES